MRNKRPKDYKQGIIIWNQEDCFLSLIKLYTTLKPLFCFKGNKIKVPCKYDPVPFYIKYDMFSKEGCGTLAHLNSIDYFKTISQAQ